MQISVLMVHNVVETQMTHGNPNPMTTVPSRTNQPGTEFVTSAFPIELVF